ncbi:MAG TPA: hypothetical protein VGV61_01895 [Thermoanaerobaculia bacterium]|nr:hypothetical protein [Thermoanaerobaculia bacterium]
MAFSRFVGGGEVGWPAAGRPDTMNDEGNASDGTAGRQRQALR